MPSSLPTLYFESEIRVVLLVDKRQFYVYRRDFSQMTKLFNEIDELVKENIGELFLPQSFSKKIQPGPEVFGEGEIRQRRRSIEKNRPDLRKEIDMKEKKP